MNKNKTFKDVVKKTLELISEFEKKEQRKWGIEGAMIELAKQVGDLSRAVMIQEKYYLPGVKMNPKYKNVKENIGDELYDVFTLVIRIADHYGINLEKECDKEFKYSMKILKKSKT